VGQFWFASPYDVASLKDQLLPKEQKVNQKCAHDMVCIKDVGQIIWKMSFMLPILSQDNEILKKWIEGVGSR